MHVAVVGAGLQGICTAYYLARQGLQVTVLEAGEGPALGASFGNGGYFQGECAAIWNTPGVLRTLPQWWWRSFGGRQDGAAMLLRTSELLRLLPWGLRFLRAANVRTFLAHTALNRQLAIYSLQCMAELRRSLDVAYAQRACGGLFVFRGEEDARAYRPLLERLASEGAEWRLLDRDELLQTEPALRPIAGNVRQAILFPRDESGDSYLFAKALMRHGQQLGVRFRFGQRILAVSADASGVRVRGAGPAMGADALVIAAGAGAKALAAQLGVHLPIAPAKGYSLTIPLGDWREAPRHVVADMGVHACINVLGDVLRVAGTAELCGYDTSISQRRIDYMVRLTAAVLPEFAAQMKRSAIRPFAGLRPLSADGLPMIGPTRVPNIYVNTGHGGLGWTQAAGSAKALADAITGAQDAFDLQPFSPQRFRR